MTERAACSSNGARCVAAATAHALLLATLLAACDGPTRPAPPPSAPALEVIALVNVQLGDTPAGEAPLYIVTGQARATRGGVPIAATIDSVTVDYRGADGDWQRDRTSSRVPIADVLPFMAVAGEPYSVRARLYAHAAHGGDTVRAQNEWIGTAQGR